MDFGRLITAMVTPFNQDGDIDYNKFLKLVDHLIDVQQSDSIVVCGTTGESPTMSGSEKLELFRLAVEASRGRAAIIAGTGCNDTRHTISFTQQASKTGVDGVLLVNPYYNRPSQEGLFQHFSAVASATDLPIMLYNIPGRTGVNLAPDTLQRLFIHRNIMAIKESSSNLEQMTEMLNLIQQRRDDFRLYSGDDYLTIPVLSIGGYGVVSVASHIVGQEIKQMISFFLVGNTKSASQIHIQLNSLFKALFCAPNPAPIKFALSELGLSTGGVRLPLVDLNEAQRTQVKSAVDKLDIRKTL